MAQNDKKYVCHTPYLRKHTSYDYDFCYTSVKWWHLQMVCSFFQILIFCVVRGVKSQKMAQNEKKFCLSHSISQEPYIIWLWFLVHIFIFSKFWFFRFLGGIKRKKMTQNYQFQSGWNKMCARSESCTGCACNCLKSAQ